ARHRLAFRSCGGEIAEDLLPARRDARHDQYRAKRDHQDLLGSSGGFPAANASRLYLRDELRHHAGTALAARLSHGAWPDGAFRTAALSLFQTSGLVV